MLKKKWVILSCNCWNIVILNVDVDRFCISWNFWLSGTMIASLYIHVGHSCRSRKPYQKMYWYIQYTRSPHVDINLHVLSTLARCLSSQILVHCGWWWSKVHRAASLQGSEFDARMVRWRILDVGLSTQQVIEFMTFRFPKSEIKCLLHMSLSSRHFSF